MNEESLDDTSSTEFLLNDYSFIPHLEIKIRSNFQPSFFDFYEDGSKSINMEELSKYLKFVVKIIEDGDEVDKKILRFDMVPCKEEMFKS